MEAARIEWNYIEELEASGRRAIEAQLPEARKITSRFPSPRDVLIPGTLFRNRELVITFVATTGDEPRWVRTAAPVERVLSHRVSVPPRSWWDPFTVAIRIENISHIDYWGAPFCYRVQFYKLKPHDLLGHHSRIDRPGWRETVEWASVCIPPMIDVDDLPTPSPRFLSREMVRGWLAIDKKRPLPWSRAH